jgi:hypothetical protein
MAYTATPETQTYQTQVLPAVSSIDIPVGSTFSLSFGMTNIVPLKEDKELWGETRYCISASKVVDAGANNYLTCRGMYVWEKTIGTIYYYVVVNDSSGPNSKVYTSTNGTTWAAVTTLTNAGTTPVRFTEFIDATNVKKLVLVDGIEGYVFTTNAAGTKIVDADFPTPHVPFPVFMDGYLFLAKASTGDIYNSDLNDPAIWTAGSFISSELYPDDVQALAKINNYILAIGTQGCEFFYDAANPTASPLARIDSASLAFGTPFPNSIAFTKNQVIFLANNNDGSVSLKLIEDLKSIDIPCPFINFLDYSIANTSGISSASIRGYFFRQSGNLFYGLAFNGVVTDPDSGDASPTYILDIVNQIWVEFRWGGNTYRFPVYFTSSTTSSKLLTYVAGQVSYPSTNANNNLVFFGTLTPTSTYVTDKVVDVVDGGTTTVHSVQQEIRTPVYDFGSLNLKTMSRFGIKYTSPSANVGNTTYFFSIGWVDTGQPTRSIRTTLVNSNSEAFSFPFITQLGSFRQRAFIVAIGGSSSGIYPIRWKGFEVEINRGQH